MLSKIIPYKTNNSGERMLDWKAIVIRTACLIIIILTACLIFVLVSLNSIKTGAVDEIKLPDGTTLLFPRRNTNDPSGDALLLGDLTLQNGCLIVNNEHYEFGVLVIWPRNATIRFDDDGMIGVLNSRGYVIALEGEAVSLGGGAETHRDSVKRLERSIQGLPIQDCPGPYWIASDDDPRPMDDSE